MKNLLFLLIFSPCLTEAQQVTLLNEETRSSFRGLSVVDNNTVWVSGSAGTVGRSVDGGKTWTWHIVKGFEKTEFRDIEAFDKMTAVIMGIGEPAYILRTADGGESWKVTYSNSKKGMFLDAMEFWNEQSGIVIGDPIDGRFFIARTFDGGKTWQDIPRENYPVADSGEACFAASGTNIRRLNKQEAVFITGGLVSNLVRRDKKIALPVIQGKETTGANSIAVKNGKTFMVAGGDFNQPDAFEKNCFITHNSGLTWAAPETPPQGYRSCVEYIGRNRWVTCGLNGADISTDNGKTFRKISDKGFHVVRKAKKGNAVFFAGGGGRIGKLVDPGRK